MILDLTERKVRLVDNVVLRNGFVVRYLHLSGTTMPYMGKTERDVVGTVHYPGHGCHKAECRIATLLVPTGTVYTEPDHIWFGALRDPEDPTPGMSLGSLTLDLRKRGVVIVTVDIPDKGVVLDEVTFAFPPPVRPPPPPKDADFNAMLRWRVKRCF